jgi:hypothetical protein
LEHFSAGPTAGRRGDKGELQRNCWPKGLEANADDITPPLSTSRRKLVAFYLIAEAGAKLTLELDHSWEQGVLATS